MRITLSTLVLAVCLTGCDQSEPDEIEEPEFVIEDKFVPLESGESWLYDTVTSYGSRGSEQGSVRLTVLGDTVLQPPRFTNDTLSVPLRYTLIRGEHFKSSGTFVHDSKIAARYTDRGLEWFMEGQGVGGWEPLILPYPNGSPITTSVEYETSFDTRKIEFRCSAPSIGWGELDRERVTTYSYDCEREGVLGISNRYDYEYDPVFVPRVALSSLYRTPGGFFTEWTLVDVSRQTR